MNPYYVSHIFRNMDQTWAIMLIVAFVLSMYSQFKVSNTFNKYSQVRSTSGMTGREVAQTILQRNNIYDVVVEPVGGNLTDHFDPRTKVVRLSESVYNSNSVSAVSVAAHEVGHAMQHHEGYFPLRLRSAIAPIANIGSRFVWILIVLGMFISPILVELAIALYLGIVIFQVVTLPVELNASRRALAQLENGIIPMDEVRGSKKVLSAAALTYIAATLTALAELLRLIAIFGRRNND